MKLNLQIRVLLIAFLSISAISNAQVFQTNNTPYNFRGVKGDSLMIIPVGCDTPLTQNPKWGTATDGAMFLKTCDTTLWAKIGQRYVQVNGVASITGGDTTIFEVVLDSTGQQNDRVLFSRNNHISSSPKILIDSANSRLIINNSNVSIGGAGMQLYVVGNGTFAGFLRVGTFEIYGIATPVTDTTTYKPLAINSSGSVRKLDRWPGSGGASTDTTSLSDRINLKVNISDTLSMLSPYIRSANYPLLKAGQTVMADTGRAPNALATGGALTKVADSLGALIGSGGGITALTGDVTASGTGSVAATLATVNSNVGSFTNANITVNAKGLVTAASSGSGGSGTVTSVGLTMPSAFSVSGSPVTTSGTLAVTGSGTTSQYIRGDGSLATYTAGLAIDSVGIVRYGTTYANNLASWDAGSKPVAAQGVGNSSATITAKDSVNYTIGFQSGLNLTSGYRNIFMGTYSGRKATTAYANIGIGAYTLGSTIAGSFTGYGNVAVGQSLQATFNAPMNAITSGYANTAVGSSHSIFSPPPGAQITTGTFNTMIGSSAGGIISTGAQNTVVGSQSGRGLTTQTGNSFFGYQAGNTTTSSYNTIIGANSGGNLTSGTLDAFGYFAGNAVTTGLRNFAIGNQSLAGAGGSTNVTGNDNVAIGVFAMQIFGSNSTAKPHARNVAIGTYAGQVYTTAVTNNISIGYGAGVPSVNDSITGSNNIAIGVLSGLPSRSGSGQIVIGSSTDGENPYRALISDISGSHRRWTLNGTTTDITANTTSATLAINGTSGGVLFPRLTTTEKNALTGTAGLVVFDTTLGKLCVYTGAAWETITSL